MVGEQTSQADRAALRERLGLNDSLPTQYVRFVTNAVQGDFGVSYRNGQKVLPLIAERFPATLELVLVATVISLLLGLPLGILTAIKARQMVHGEPAIPVHCRSVAAKLRGWYSADPRLFGDHGLGACVWARRRGAAWMVVHGVLDLVWTGGADPAFDRLVALSDHAGHAIGPGGNARGATLRLCKVCPCTRHSALAHLFSSRTAQLSHAGCHHDSHEYQVADRFRADHRDRLSVAWHGHAVHPGRDLSRYSGHGGLPLHHFLHLCCPQHAG